MEVDGGSKVETVYIPEMIVEHFAYLRRWDVPLIVASARPATGVQRNLTAAEIGQVFLAVKSFGLPVKDSQKRAVTNVVMMGMGEPLLNFEPVVDAMSLMLEDQAYCLSKRRVTLSTSGLCISMN